MVKKRADRSGTHPCMHDCRHAAARWGNTSPVANLSRLGNSDDMPGMPGQVFGIFCCLIPLPPHPYPFSPITHTRWPVRERERSAELIAAWKEVSVWDLCLSSSPRRHKKTTPVSFLARGWGAQEQARRGMKLCWKATFLVCRTERRMTTVQRDHINRWTDCRLSLPADVIQLRIGFEQRQTPTMDISSTCKY